MTKKELEVAANDWVDKNCFDCDAVGEHRSKESFIAGAKWQFEHPTGGQLFYVLQKGADLGRKNTTDKACEFITSNIWEYLTITHCGGEEGVQIDTDRFEKDFRKAMEDQK